MLVKRSGVKLEKLPVSKGDKKYMDKAKVRIQNRLKRASRIRNKISGTSAKPRLCIRRTLTHIYAQLIDDDAQRTLLQVGSSGKEFSGKLPDGKPITKTAEAALVGELVAEKALALGVTQIVFDRKGYLYHGRVKALADSARSKGLVF